MADISSRTNFVKTVLSTPAWYLLSEREENELFKYIREARNIEEVHLYRVMDCSTICFLFFLCFGQGDIHKLCSACNIVQRN